MCRRLAVTLASGNWLLLSIRFIRSIRGLSRCPVPCPRQSQDAEPTPHPEPRRHRGRHGGLRRGAQRVHGGDRGGQVAGDRGFRGAAGAAEGDRHGAAGGQGGSDLGAVHAGRSPGGGGDRRGAGPGDRSGGGVPAHAQAVRFGPLQRLRERPARHGGDARPRGGVARGHPRAARPPAPLQALAPAGDPRRIRRDRGVAGALRRRLRGVAEHEEEAGPPRRLGRAARAAAGPGAVPARRDRRGGTAGG